MLKRNKHVHDMEPTRSILVLAIVKSTAPPSNSITLTHPQQFKTAIIFHVRNRGRRHIYMGDSEIQLLDTNSRQLCF